MHSRSELRDCSTVALDGRHQKLTASVIVYEIAKIGKTLRRPTATEAATETIAETTPAKYKQDNYPPGRTITPATIATTVVVHHCSNHVGVKSTLLTQRRNQGSIAVATVGH